MSRYALEEVAGEPAFRDAAGNLVIQGDWLMVGVGGRSSYGPRLARVISIEVEEAQELVEWRTKPVEEWTEYERKYCTERNPAREAIYETYNRPKVKVAQYPDMGPSTRPIRRDLLIAQALKYDGRVPFDLA